MNKLTKPKMFEKPTGVKDYLPDAVRKLRSIEMKVLSCMEQWGYEEIRTPALEFYDTVGAASTTSDPKLFKLLDKNGTTMVLRSELTAPIARVVTSLLRDEPLPLRLSYHANVFRAMEEETGRDAEFYQTGVELVGDGSAEADAEIIALAAASLRAAGIEDFKIALGHAGFLNGLFREALHQQEATQANLKECLLRRNYVGYTEEVKSLSISDEAKAELEGVLRLHGGRDVCEQARKLTSDPEAQAAMEHLNRVLAALDDYGVADQVMIDLTMVGDFSYYTGIVFEGYVDKLGFPVCSGGRYDNLLEQFGRPAPATGFALKTTRILEMLNGEEPQRPHRVLVLYHPEKHKEAVRYAMARRAEQGYSHGIAVELRQISADEDEKTEQAKLQCDEIIAFK